MIYTTKGELVAKNKTLIITARIIFTHIRIVFLSFLSAKIPPIKLKRTCGIRETKSIRETRKFDPVRKKIKKMRTTFIMLKAIWENTTDNRKKRYGLIAAVFTISEEVNLLKNFFIAYFYYTARLIFKKEGNYADFTSVDTTKNRKQDYARFV